MEYEVTVFLACNREYYKGPGWYQGMYVHSPYESDEMVSARVATENTGFAEYVDFSDLLKTAKESVEEVGNCETESARENLLEIAASLLGELILMRGNQEKNETAANRVLRPLSHNRALQLIQETELNGLYIKYAGPPITRRYDESETEIADGWITVYEALRAVQEQQGDLKFRLMRGNLYLKDSEEWDGIRFAQSGHNEIVCLHRRANKQWEAEYTA